MCAAGSVRYPPLFRLPPEVTGGGTCNWHTPCHFMHQRLTSGAITPTEAESAAGALPTPVQCRVRPNRAWAKRFMRQWGIDSWACNTAGTYLDFNSEAMNTYRCNWREQQAALGVPLGLRLNYDQLWKTPVSPEEEEDSQASQQHRPPTYPRRSEMRSTEQKAETKHPGDGRQWRVRRAPGWHFIWAGAWGGRKVRDGAVRSRRMHPCYQYLGRRKQGAVDSGLCVCVVRVVPRSARSAA